MSDPHRAIVTMLRYAALVLALAVGGTLLFGAAHALLIAPIWSRLGGGLPFALLAAGAITWGYGELVRSRRLSLRLRDGALYGSLLWLSVLPTTLLGVVFRLTGLHQSIGALELISELAVAAATGLIVGLLTRSKRLALCLAVVVVALVVAMAGPIPVTNGRTPMLLLLSFVPIYVVAGVLIVATLRLFDRSFLVDHGIS